MAILIAISLSRAAFVQFFGLRGFSKNCGAGYRQWHRSNAHPFLGNDCHRATAGTTQPKVAELMMLPSIVVSTAIDCPYKYSSIPESTELRGTRRIETFSNHYRCYLALGR